MYNKIRGLNPFPASWTNIQTNGEEISAKIYAVKKEECDHSFSIGKIISNKKELKVAVKNGFINVLEIKLAGKKLMDIKSLLNGFSFSEDSKML